MHSRYLLCLPMLTVGFAVAGWGQVPTPAPMMRSIAFTPVGLASSETVRINVANIASNSQSTAATCSGTITFDNAAGAAVEPAVKFTVTAGQIYSTSLAASTLGVAYGTREELIGSVVWTQVARTPCTLVVSLETFDSPSGVTHLYISSAGGGGPVTVNVFGGN